MEAASVPRCFADPLRPVGPWRKLRIASLNRCNFDQFGTREVVVSPLSQRSGSTSHLKI